MNTQKDGVFAHTKLISSEYTLSLYSPENYITCSHRTKSLNKVGEWSSVIRQSAHDAQDDYFSIAVRADFGHINKEIISLAR